MRTTTWSRLEPVDLVVAAALTLALQAEIWIPGVLGAESVTEDRLLLSLTSLAVSIPLVVRRTHPWPMAIIALGAEVVQQLLTTPPEGLANLVTMLLVCYSLGRYARRPRGYAGILLIAAVAFGVGQDLADNTFVLLVLGAAWSAGLVVAVRTDDLGALELRRLAATRAGAEEERLRIARELHDVVAHRVSMMVVQSELADAMLERDPGRAREAIVAVESTGREALAELRSVLGLMHDVDRASLAPVDTELSRLGEVIDEARAGGLPVTLETTGTARAVPPAVALAAFRIVQESLTNVVRHAASAATTVRLRYRPGDVEVTVENEGPVLAAVRPGHGLAGMGERATFLGGTLTTEPLRSGGFRVCATLPTPQAVP
jgi:signal transduction histidine kinase